MLSLRAWILPVLAVVWLWPAAAGGQSPELIDAFKRFSESYAQGLNALGVLYHAQRRYAEAETLHMRALAIRQEALGPVPRPSWRPPSVGPGRWEGRP